jgi:IstB-like ATP binding protein
VDGGRHRETTSLRGFLGLPRRGPQVSGIEISPKWDRHGEPPAVAHLLFQLVSRRLSSVLVTSNRTVGDWGAVLGELVVAAAILDRLLHHSHVLTIRGGSYRLRKKRRSGLLKAAQAGAPATVED